MKFTENDLFLYICGDLPDDKAAEVEIALSNDTKLMANKEKLQKMNQNARDFGNAEFQKQRKELGITDAEINQKFSEFKKQIRLETSRRNTFRRAWGFTYAAVLVLLLFSLLVFQPFGKKSVHLTLHPSENPPTPSSLPQTATETHSPTSFIPSSRPAAFIISPEMQAKLQPAPEERLRGLLLLDSGIDPVILYSHIPGEVIVRVDDQPLGTFAELREILKGRGDDEKVRIHLQRQGIKILIGTLVPVGWLRAFEPGVHVEEYQATSLK